jgi:hypothetical protein
MLNMLHSLYALYKIRMSLAILISVVPLAITTIYLYRGFYEYGRHFRQADVSSMSLALYRSLVRTEIQKEINRITSPAPAKESVLKTFRIFIDKRHILQLNSNLPESGKADSYPAFMRVDNDEKKYKIGFRYRGDNPGHWFYKQKSFRIKNKNDSLYNLERTFNLINPPSMIGVAECINYQMAKEAGLISPDCFPARVFVNGEYLGVYIYVSQVDESTLRKAKRMPGSIYYGDKGVLADHKTRVSDLWSNADRWIKKASRNFEQKENRADIEHFITAVNSYDDSEFYEFFNLMANKQTYYSFIGLDTYFGSRHHDYNHNHKIYFDPYLGKYEPIAWDLRMWFGNSEKDLSLYPLLNRIKLNPILEYERDLHLYEMMQRDSFQYSSVEREVRQLVERVRADMIADRYRDGWVPIPPYNLRTRSHPYTMSQFDLKLESRLSILKRRIARVQKILDHSEVEYRLQSLGGNRYHLALSVNGNSPIRFDFRSLFGNVAGLRVFRDLNFNQALEEEEARLDLSDWGSEIAYPGREKRYLPPSEVLHLDPSALVYSYIVEAAEALEVPEQFSAENAITQSEIIARRTQAKLSTQADSVHPWTLFPPAESSVSLSGVIQVTEDLVYSRYTTVTVMPGTVFELDPGKSIYFYGKVQAVGTQDAPIIFRRNEPEEPWGGVVLQGQGASDSRLEFVQLAGGSIATRNHIYYTGQFNIHDAEDVLIRNCDVGENSIGDDSMHIAYASVLVDGCVFHDAMSDALDVDVATVTIENSVFKNSGNDGLDLMTTQAVVKNNLFVDSGDKGISTGEWSTGEFYRNVFVGNFIGLEIKDKSKVSLKDSTFLDSGEWDINLYLKNPRYDEGGSLIAETLYSEEVLKINADKHSSYTVEFQSVKIPRDFQIVGNELSPGAPASWSQVRNAVREIVH